MCFFALSFKIKNYSRISFNEDIFNDFNIKRDCSLVQLQSLLAEKDGTSPTRGNVAKRQKDCRPTLVDCACINFLLMLLRFTTKDYVQIPLSFFATKKTIKRWSHFVGGERGSASTLSLRWTCPSLLAHHLTSAPKEPNQNSFFATKKGHQNRCPLSWRRKRDLNPRYAHRILLP